MAELRGPAYQLSVGVKVARQALQFHVVDRSRGFTRAHQSLFGNHLRAKMLEVARSRCAREHVQQFDVSRNVAGTGKLVV